MTDPSSTRVRPRVEPIQTSSSGLNRAWSKPPVRQGGRVWSGPSPSPLRQALHCSDVPASILRNKSIYENQLDSSSMLSHSIRVQEELTPKPLPTPYPRSPHPRASQYDTNEKRVTRAQKRKLAIMTHSGSTHTPTKSSSESPGQAPPKDIETARELYFQHFREQLWKRGAEFFGHESGADAFIAPLKLPTASDGSISNDTGQSSARYGLLTVRVVVRSKDRSPIGLRREFDLSHLRATIPEPTPSPKSPNFDREALFASMTQEMSEEGQNQGSQHNRPSFSSSEKAEEDGSEYRSLPMHVHYARAQLPVLASIMMSSQVRRGDTIDLPVPHPLAWPETVAFVYTGEDQLITEEVKQNILYLGGKV